MVYSNMAYVALCVKSEDLHFTKKQNCEEKTLLNTRSDLLKESSVVIHLNTYIVIYSIPLYYVILCLLLNAQLKSKAEAAFLLKISFSSAHLLSAHSISEAGFIYKRFFGRQRKHRLKF